jgi:tellurite resistance protein TerC
MPTQPWMWLALSTAIVVMLAVDLRVAARPGGMTLRSAAVWSAAWLAVGLAFAAAVWLHAGPAAGGEYLAGYLIERSLSIDNVFVLALILSTFAVPPRLRGQVLVWGIAGALLLRVVFIFAGIELLERLAWAAYVLGLLLVATGIRLLRHRQPRAPDPSGHPIVKGLRILVPFTTGFHGRRLVVRHGGGWMATPLLAVLAVIAATDLLFAVDSIPAILAVTQDPFIVVGANAFALLGLRALAACLDGMMERFVYLNAGLSAILVFIGAKMIYGELAGAVPLAVSLPIILVILTGAVGASLLRTRGMLSARM